MKPCISLYCYHDLVGKNGYTHFDAIDKTKELGYEALELQISNHLIPEGYDLHSYAKALHRYATERGLAVPILTLAANFYVAEPKVEYDRIKALIDTAGELNIPLMRIDVAHKFMGNETSKTPRLVISAVAPYITSLADYARERNVKLCSENHGRLIQDFDRVEELLYAVNSDNYGWLLDMGNFGSADNDYVLAVSKLLPSICFVHAKDSFVRSGMNYDPGRGYSVSRGGNYRRNTIFGHGNVPTYQVLNALEKFGYDGYVSLEYEGIEDPIMAIEISTENLFRMLEDVQRKRG